MSNYTFTAPQDERQSRARREKSKYENTVFALFITVCLGIALLFGNPI